MLDSLSIGTKYTKIGTKNTKYTKNTKNWY